MVDPRVFNKDDFKSHPKKGNSEVNIFLTGDLGIAAFLFVKGLAIHSVKKTNNRYVYSFKDPENKGNDLKFEYANSDCRAFDSAVRTLKKLSFDFKR